MTGISFIISTGGTNDAMVNTVIDSIESQGMSEYEIIVTGGDATTIDRANTTYLPFDEHQKAHIMLHGFPGRWTTRKKNLAVQAAKYDVVVVMHDYIKFTEGWYTAFEQFGTDWDISVHQCLCSNGIRGDGWRIMEFPGLPKWCMIPYDIDTFVQFMGIQGGYWVAKKSTMLEYPLNEDLLWGMEEDTEWSRRVIPNCRVKMNAGCVVQYLKPRPDDPNHAIDVQTMNDLEPFWNELRRCLIKNRKLVRE
jgi:hypothetical protein